MGFPAAAGGDLADLLDVDVDQFTGAVAFVAHRGGLRGPDDLAGQRVTLAQLRDAVAAQDPAHGPGWDAEFGTEPVLAAALLAAIGHDRFLDCGRCLVRAVVRALGPVVEASFAFGAEPVDPAVRTLAGDTLGLGRVRDGPVLLADPFDKELPPAKVQPGITLGHEDLRMVDDLDSAHRTRSVTNLVAEYS